MSIDKVISDIKSLNIQGAEAVSLSSVEALRDNIKDNDYSDKDLGDKIHELTCRLASSRPTEPFLRNCIFYVRNAFDTGGKKTKEEAIGYCDFVIDHINDSRKMIAEIGENKIKSGMCIFTHCHSSTVTAILKLAKDRGKVFTVYNTETRPLFQGRKTAKELSDHGITVKHMIDSAARIGLKKSDIAFIGSDAVTSEGRVINKIGSEMFSEIARRYDVPFYSCANSWKLDPHSVFGFDEPIEERATEEVWEKPPEHVKILNPAFEIIRSDLVTGIISEIGVFTPEVFVSEVRDRYPFLFLNQEI